MEQRTALNLQPRPCESSSELFSRSISSRATFQMLLIAAEERIRQGQSLDVPTNHRLCGFVGDFAGATGASTCAYLTVPRGPLAFWLAVDARNANCRRSVETSGGTTAHLSLMPMDIDLRSALLEENLEGSMRWPERHGLPRRTDDDTTIEEDPGRRSRDPKWSAPTSASGWRDEGAISPGVRVDRRCRHQRGYRTVTNAV
jgi:hypothetical protein